MKNLKKGNIEIIVISISIIIFIIIMSGAYLLYIQINSYIYPIKQDIFYIVQNSSLSFEKEELRLFNYIVDEEKFKKNIDILINKNYKNIEIENLTYDKNTNNVYITINVELTPIIMSSKMGKIKIKLSEKVKIKMMEVE